MPCVIWIDNIARAASNEYLVFRESLHALKGSAAEMGAYRITELCRQAENLKPQQLNEPETEKLVQSLLASFEQTVQILNSTAFKKRSGAE